MRSYFYQEHLSKTRLLSLDFEDFLETHKPSANDFIFIDPPYDSDFSTYTNNIFGREDQIRLAKYLLHNRAQFMLVIKNTEFIKGLYSDKGLRIETFDKRYLVSFQNRNDHNAEHLMIMNY